jgi:hypothetical protein
VRARACARHAGCVLVLLTGSRKSGLVWVNCDHCFVADQAGADTGYRHGGASSRGLG